MAVVASHELDELHGVIRRKAHDEFTTIEGE